MSDLADIDEKDQPEGFRVPGAVLWTLTAP